MIRQPVPRLRGGRLAAPPAALAPLAGRGLTAGGTS
jgi:hypothetical protein